MSQSTQPDVGPSPPENASPASPIANVTPATVVFDEAEYDSDDLAHRSDDEAASRLVQIGLPKQRKVTQKKKVEQASFGEWLAGNRERLSKKAREQGSSNQHQSIEYLVKSWEGQKIINNPRDYQLELFAIAKEKNTIAVLDTGSGKTLIAVLLLQHIIGQELEDRARGLPRRLSFFLVDKVALVYQQHAVLDCNLGYPVAAFSGESVQHSWNKTFWLDQFAKHEVIVCTAEILNKCLQYAYIRIDQINLLVIDEAHHTKKNHPYARIIKDYYYAAQEAPPTSDTSSPVGLDRTELISRLPRIFGMTASPVDAQVDVRRAATELEGLLHSQIATISDPMVLLDAVSKPKAEIISTYPRLVGPRETALTAKLRAAVGGNKLLAKAFAFSKYASSELGPWFVDRNWQLTLKDDEIVKLEENTERNLTNINAPAETVTHHMSGIQMARVLLQKHEFEEPEELLLSPKVNVLLRLLKEHFKDATNQVRCIVFVDQRWTAKLLADLLQQNTISIPGLRVGVLIGANKFDGPSQTSFRQQLLTIIKFKKGKLNCVFATSVAEEGLDIPDCNLVIRFDLYRTTIQYIQSRGRARQALSTYVHMVEDGNGEHRRRIYQNTTNESSIRQFCSSLPEDRKLKGSDFNMDYFLRKERNQRQKTIVSSGAKITYKNSIAILGDFVNSLRRQDSFTVDMKLSVDHVISPSQGGFICEVIMPVASPVSGCMGNVHSTKQVAKCSAAFEVCLKLLKNHFLDDNLRSRFVERRNKMASARLAISAKKKAKYKMRRKPELWAELGTPNSLYAAVLNLSNPHALTRYSRPLIMLTREKLPQIKAFPLFLGQFGRPGTCSDLFCLVLNTPIQPTDGELKLFAKFTLKIFTDVFNKMYVADPSGMPYFLAPAVGSHEFPFRSVSDFRETVDWPLLRQVFHTDVIPYTGEEPDEFFTEKYIIDPHDGSRRFWLNGICKGLTPLSPIPKEVEHFPSYREWKRGEVAHNILNWSATIPRGKRGLVTTAWKENQPVVAGALAPLRRDFLSEIEEHGGNNPSCFLVLEPLRISPLPVDVVAMAYLFPSIIHRMEQNLIALDACKLLGLDIHPDLALEAMTKGSENLAEHDDTEFEAIMEPVDFQLGMGSNYERLEFLGDAFLKLATTLSLFTLIPNKDEFDYHVERMIMVCNQNLYGVARSDWLRLEEFIRTKSFSRGAWYPDLKLAFGKAHQKTLQNLESHSLADKSIADACEALIGAAYMTTRKENNYDLAVQAVTRFTAHKHHPMTKWEDYYAAYKKPAWQTTVASAAELDLADRILDVTKYKFKHPRLLRSAFAHPSRPYSFVRVPNYQRLEFLGDALLDMACVDYLFHLGPDKGPQWLTEHKMAMVSNQFLACLAVELRFHKYLLHNGTLGEAILEYVTEITEARCVAEDAAQALGKSRSEYSRDFWIEVRQPPKCIADVLEAYIGAIFVDSEYDFGNVRRFFELHVRPYFTDLRIYDRFAKKHPVTFCTQFIYKRFGCHEYGLQSEEIQIMDDAGTWTGSTKVAAGILIHGQVVDGAMAESGRYAKVHAARKALDKLQMMTTEQFSKQFACDCKPGEAATDIGESSTAI